MFNSYSNKNENFPTTRVLSLCGDLPNTNLKLEIDHILLSQLNKNIIRISGLLKLKNGLIVKTGLSSNRFDQKTGSTIIKNIFSDLGLGIAYGTDDLIIDLGTYSYGPGGHIIGFGISSKF